MTPEPHEPDEPFPLTPIDPDLLAWAKQAQSIQEILDGIREIQEIGGVQLEDFIGEIEAVVRGS